MKKPLFATLLLMVSLTLSFSYSDEIENVKTENFVVVQLFTSQGCSSCPRADRLLEEIKNKDGNDNVLVLSYHVDYWNRLGWKDPFSKKEYSDAQYAYGSKFGGERVYTPQAVINGSKHFVGSNESEMNKAIKEYLAEKAVNVVNISDPHLEGNKITVDYKVDGNTVDKNLVLALVIDKRKTEIKRGENGGKTLSNSNIVVEDFKMPLLDHKKSGKIRITIPEIVNSDDKLRIVAFVQDQNLEISGANSLEI